MPKQEVNKTHPARPRTFSFAEPLWLCPAACAPDAHEFVAPGEPIPDICSLTLVRQGRGVRIAGGEEFAMGPGLVLLSVAATQQRFEGDSAIRAATLCIHADWLLEAIRPLWSLVGLVRILIATRLFPVSQELVNTMVFEPTREELEAIEAEWGCFEGHPAVRAGSLTLRTGALLKIIAVLNECLERADHGSRMPLQFSVWQVAEVIESAVTKGLPVDIGELAAMVDMPQARFARMFRDATGIPPREYIQLRRIQYGARMLIEEMDTVTEIALRLGYADAAHFCRVFKRIKGFPPNEFRRRHAQKPTAGNG